MARTRDPVYEGADVNRGKGVIKQYEKRKGSHRTGGPNTKEAR